MTSLFDKPENVAAFTRICGSLHEDIVIDRSASIAEVYGDAVDGQRRFIAPNSYGQWQRAERIGTQDASS
jgi:hypothetical protein